MTEKEQKLLDAALKLFVEKGFHGTSTAEITKTAGVATGTLFHYFKTKEELINQLYLFTKENILKDVAGCYDNKKPLKENMKSLWLKFVHYSIANPYKFQFILIFHCSPYITSLTKEQVETRTEDMLGVYKKGIETRQLKYIPFEMAIEHIWGNIVSTVNYFAKYPQELNEKNLDVAFELFWSGISK
ncbi:TetR/AcrR family transcriptional regulator [Methanobacterium sp.]|uniref:TetR/AcrR family transcriptional regulator n=1 Tax=Methanobacterium sp. TaxID=2164 RepID=UPI003C785CE8